MVTVCVCFKGGGVHVEAEEKTQLWPLPSLLLRPSPLEVGGE